jgi:hypothetical protein
MSSDLMLLALRLKRADAEFRRAQATGEQPQLANAGTSYAIAKIRLFRAAEEARQALAQPRNHRKPPNEPNIAALQEAFEAGFWAWNGPANDRELAQTMRDLGEAWDTWSADYLARKHANCAPHQNSLSGER